MIMRKIMSVPFYIAVILASITIADWPAISTVWTDPFGVFLMLGAIVFFAAYLAGIPIYIPRCKNFSFFLIFIIYHVVAGVFLYYNLSSYVFDTRLALQKYITYMFFLCIMLIVDVYIYNILIRTERSIYVVAKILFASFVLQVIYSMLQFLDIVGIQEAAEVINNIGPYFGTGELRIYLLKVYGLTSEPSALANYIIFMLPWLFLLYHNYKRKSSIKWIFIMSPIIGMFVLFITFSRTAYFGTIISLILGAMVFNQEIRAMLKRKKKKLIIGICLLGFFVKLILGSVLSLWDAPVDIEHMTTVVWSSFLDADNRNTSDSNITRVAGMESSINIFLEHPLLGTGFGTQSLYQMTYYPKWALNSSEVVEGITTVSEKTHLYREMPTIVISRVFSEGGAIGMIIWIIVFMSIIIDSFIVSKRVNEKDRICFKSIAWMTITSQILAFNIPYIFSYVYVLLLPIYWSSRDNMHILIQQDNIENKTVS